MIQRRAAPLAPGAIYCDGPPDDPAGDVCGRPVDRLGKCQAHRKQFQRNGTMTPLQVKGSAEEQFIEAAAKWLESDTDAEFARNRAAMLEAGFVFLRHEATAALRRDKGRQRAIAAGIAKAVREGRFGRPKKVTLEQVRQLVAKFKGIPLHVAKVRVAKRLKVHVRTIRRLLPTAKKPKASVRGRKHGA